MRAQVGLKVCGGLGTAKMSCGVITAPVLGDIYMETMRHLDGETPDIYLADLRMPVWAMTVLQLGAWFDGADPAVCAPAALIVALGAYDLFRAHRAQ